MKALIGLSQVAVALSLFSSLAAALPPVVQPRTTPSPSLTPATRIVTTSLAPTSTEPARSATPTCTAISNSIPSPESQPPNPISIPTSSILNAILELRSDLAETTTLDPSSPITELLLLPSDLTSARDFQENWYQTTYWSCITDAVQTHCGWHEPVLPGGNDSIAAAVLERRPRPLLATGAAVVGAVLVAMGWGGWVF